MPDAHLQIISDIAKYCEGKLISSGRIVDSNLEDRDKIEAYIATQRRATSLRPRQVHLAAHFTCPTEHNAGFQKLKLAIESGESVRPYKSKKTDCVDFEDQLYNHWKIEHFHLGETIEGGWAKRTGPLLFAYIENEDVYCLGVFQHGDWHRQKLIQTIHDNWPSLLEIYKIRGIEGLVTVPSDEDIKTLRSGNINSSIQVQDGTVYFSPGQGVAGDGRSAEVRFSVIQLTHEVSNFEKTFKDWLKSDESKNLCKEKNFNEAILSAPWNCQIDANGNLFLCSRNNEIGIPTYICMHLINE